MLRPGAFPHAVERLEIIETHISWVILTGPWAYKIKKPLALPFVDFSTLSARAAACQDELRLNRRWSGKLYRDLCPIHEGPEGPCILEPGSEAQEAPGGSRPVDWAVRMRQFDQQRLLTACLERGELEARHLEAFALELARFHGRVHHPASAPAGEQGYARPEAVAEAVLDNYRHLLEDDLDGEDLARRDRLRDWSEGRLEECRETLERRRSSGLVREGHGDLHLGNMLLLDGQVELFDCLEFSAELRWGDVVCEIAFLVMDLAEHGRRDLAGRFLNAYLERTGDYRGLDLLPLFVTYRALVRAKVSQFQRAEMAAGSERRAGLLEEVRTYLRLAETWTQAGKPRLAVMSGLSGSGKTFESVRFVDRGFIRLRSDFERKRLAGLVETRSLDTHPEAGAPSLDAARLYAAEATRMTYASLLEHADACLAAGFSTVVDATCLKRWQRQAFRDLAERRGLEFRLFVLEHEVSELERRIRRRGDSDLSDADVAVLHGQIERRQELDPEELSGATIIDGRKEPPSVVIDRWLAASA